MRSSLTFNHSYYASTEQSSERGAFRYCHEPISPGSSSPSGSQYLLWSYCIDLFPSNANQGKILPIGSYYLYDDFVQEWGYIFLS